MSRAATFAVCIPTWQEIDKAFKDTNYKYAYDIDPYNPKCDEIPEPVADYKWFVDVIPEYADEARKILETFDTPIKFWVG